MKEEFRDLVTENKNEANVFLVGVPSDKMASIGKGARYAPETIRKCSADEPPCSKEGFDLRKIKLYDCGDILLKGMDFDKLTADFEDFFKNTGFSLILGGDHSITIGSEYAFLKRAKRNGKTPVIIHLDAHPDICKSYKGSEYSHACTNYKALEHGYEDENLVMVGIRGFEIQEVEFLKEHKKIDVFKAKDIQLLGGTNFVNLMEDKYSDPKYEIYLSYDIDANDPAFAPGTGTPEAFGLSTKDTLEIVTGLIGKLNVTAMDIVEVAPPLDPNLITVWLAIKTIYEVFYTLIQKNSFY